eukprot:m.156520 g.156520  ORF g.156520 m.156520 type:complete len:101 (+) comp16442_c1_seq8:3553-3855(+)
MQTPSIKAVAFLCSLLAAVVDHDGAPLGRFCGRLPRIHPVGSRPKAAPDTFIGIQGKQTLITGHLLPFSPPRKYFWLRNLFPAKVGDVIYMYSPAIVVCN